jgi:hypothetical protein
MEWEWDCERGEADGEAARYAGPLLSALTRRGWPKVFTGQNANAANAIDLKDLQRLRANMF